MVLAWCDPRNSHMDCLTLNQVKLGWCFLTQYSGFASCSCTWSWKTLALNINVKVALSLSNLKIQQDIEIQKKSRRRSSCHCGEQRSGRLLLTVIRSTSFISTKARWGTSRENQHLWVWSCLNCRSWMVCAEVVVNCIDRLNLGQNFPFNNGVMNHGHGLLGHRV